MSENQRNLYLAIITTCVIFLIISLGLILLVIIYNRRKKRHTEEKAQMRLSFETEIAKAQYEVQEQTMQTIGADLHDNIGQLLSLTSLTLNSIELADAVKAKQKIEDSIDLTLRSIKEMRQLGKLLQGDQLVTLGLSEAIRHEINWLERSGRFEISYEPEQEMPAAGDPAKDLILFRILQEILNNIIKHASASRISIKLTHIEGQLTLQVEDDGVGFNAGQLTTEQNGMGLQNIHKRAGIIGGCTSINSNPGKGTTVIVFIPYP